jgi:hypothetical protein
MVMTHSFLAYTDIYMYHKRDILQAKTALDSILWQRRHPQSVGQRRATNEEDWRSGYMHQHHCRCRVAIRCRKEGLAAARTSHRDDLLTAAQAIALDLTLGSDNEREFKRIEGLSCANWLI